MAQLYLCVPPAGYGQLHHVLHGGIQMHFVLGSGLPALVLRL